MEVRGWKASPGLTGSLPSVRETIITPSLQLLSHLPWPIEWSLRDSASPRHRMVAGVWMAQGQQRCLTIVTQSYSSWFLSLFLLLFSLLLASPLGNIRVLTWWKASSHLSSAYHHILLCFLVLFLFLW